MVYRVPETLKECDGMQCAECYYFSDFEEKGHCIALDKLLNWESIGELIWKS